jgi:hypothetical protein
MLVRVAKKLETTVGALVGEAETELLETDVYRGLAESGAMELLQAYRAMTTERRKAFLELARTIK